MVLIYPLIPISSHALKLEQDKVHPGFYRHQSIALLGKPNFQLTGRQNGLRSMGFGISMKRVERVLVYSKGGCCSGFND